MIFRFLHKLGIPSDVFYLASLGSIGTSIAAWAVRSDDDSSHAERLGIFIGLWAPTFMLIGHGLHELEVNDGFQSKALEDAAHKFDGAGEQIRTAAGSAVGH